MSRGNYLSIFALHRLRNNRKVVGRSSMTTSRGFPAYDEPVKVLARNTALTAAVSILTRNRNSAPLVPREYVSNIKNEIVTEGGDACRKEAQLLSTKVIKRWEKFHDSILQKKSPSDLKVAFLCGPNPENDVNSLIDLGILEENIWAFENDNNTYEKAVLNSLASRFPFIKIYRGSIDDFLRCSKQRFDIIYLDFCGPIVSSKKSAHRVIASVLSQNAIAHNGVLISNVSFPPKRVENEPQREMLSELACLYLFNKDNVDGHNIREEGLEYSNWKTRYHTQQEHIYSLFVTRLLMDIGLVCTPVERFFDAGSNGGPLFKFDERKLHESAELLTHIDIPTSLADGNGEQSGDIWIGDATLEDGKYAIVNAIRGMLEPEKVIANVSGEFRKFAAAFVRGLSSTSDENFGMRIQCLLYLLSSDHACRNFEFLVESTRRVVEAHSSSQYHQFCDVVCRHQILELLFCQLTAPYHFNVSASKRWRYCAKETPMFMDMAVFDQCRYVYDWMPTLDMFSHGMNDKERQLSYRFALDGIRKHAFHYNSEFLAGTHVVPVHSDRFSAKLLPDRIDLNRETCVPTTGLFFKRWFHKT